jgi:hypothetical protein
MEGPDIILKGRDFLLRRRCIGQRSHAFFMRPGFEKNVDVIAKVVPASCIFKPVSGA